MPTKQLATTPLRIPIELKDWIKSRAASNLRSVNAEVISLLLAEKRKHELVQTQQ